MIECVETSRKRHSDARSEDRRENYYASLDNQLKVNEKLVDQVLVERARLQMRTEQLENPNYMQELSDDIQRAT